MNADRHNPSFDRGPEPLPIDFDPTQIQVDRLLSRSARVSAGEIPAGLSQRVYEMSVASLPTSVVAEPALRLVEADASFVSITRHATSTRWRLGWTALAASVLLVAGATLWMNWPKAPAIDSGSIAGGPSQPLVRTASVDFGDLNRLAASNPSEIDAFESEFTYLLDASEVRSFKDLNNDLRQFVAQLEM